MKSALICVLLLIPSVAYSVLPDATVKYEKANNKVLLSTTKICHSPESRYYKGLKRIEQSFDTLVECLKSTEQARLPKTKEGLEEAEKILEEQITIVKEKKYQAIEGKKAADAAIYSQKEEELKSTKEKTSKVRDDLNAFTGLGFGIGMAFTHIDGDYIDSVEIQEGKVFVKKSQSHRGVFMLESHKFFQPKAWTKRGWVNSGVGPFVALSIADTEGGDPFSAYGMGVMVGFKEKEGGGSWNMGIGYFVNTKYRTLRKGIEDGTDTTETNPENLIVERDSTGVMIIVSSTW